MHLVMHFYWQEVMHGRTAGKELSVPFHCQSAAETEIIFSNNPTPDPANYNSRITNFPDDFHSK